MMNDETLASRHLLWLDLTKIIPGLGKGQRLHIVNTPLDPLIKILAENNFVVIVIEGSEVIDSASFFRQAKQVFNFPDYFGQNWDAWDECLGDFGTLIKQRTVVIWKDADKTFSADAKTFIQAVFDLYNMALSTTSYQVELFLVGTTGGFKNVLFFKE